MHFWFFLTAGILLCLMLICNCVMTILTSKNDSFSKWESEQKYTRLLYRIRGIMLWLSIVFILISLFVFIGTDLILLSKILYWVGLLCMATQDALDLVRYIKFYCNKDKESKEKENNGETAFEEAKTEKEETDEIYYEVK